MLKSMYSTIFMASPIVAPKDDTTKDFCNRPPGAYKCPSLVIMYVCTNADAP